MDLKCLITILWTFKGAPPCRPLGPKWVHFEKKNVLLRLHFLSDRDDGSKYKNKIKNYSDP